MEYLSQKGVRYVLHPKRGSWTDINPDVAKTLTARGQTNLIGTFVSPDIEYIIRNPVQGGGRPCLYKISRWYGGVV